MAQINGNLSVVGEILDLKLEKLAADPTGGGLVESRVWYNTVTKALKLYNGTAAVEIGGGVSAEDLADALVPYAQTTDVNSAISAAVSDLVSGTEMQGAIDNALAGLDFQEDILGVEGIFTNVAGRYIYVDGSLFTSGVAAEAGDIVVVDATGEITAIAYDVSVAGPGALAWNRDTENFYRWNGTNWAEFGGLVGFTAGDGLEKVGDVVSVKAADASIVVAAGGVSVGDLSGTYVTPAAQTSAINAAVSGLQSAAQVTAAIEAAVADFQDEAEVNALVVAALTDYAKSADVTSEISAAVTGLASTQSVTNAIENALAGLDFQSDVLGLESDFAGVAGRYIYVDGTTFATGVAASANDIVVVDAAGEILEVAYDVSAAGPGALVWNRDATLFIRWDGAAWAEFGGISGVTAGNGIEKTGDVVSVKAADASIVVAAGGISVGDLSATYVTPAALDTATADFLVEADVAPIVTVVNNLQTQVGTFFFPFDSGATSATSHTVTHNIGFRWPIVQVVDKATNKVIIPDDVSFTDANELVVTLGVAAAVLVQVSWYKNGA